MTAPIESVPADEPEVPGEAATDTTRQKPRRVLKRFLRNKVAVVATAFILLLILVAILAPLVAPQDPNAQALTDRLHPPGGKYLLGADEFGRDLLSRIIYGARVSLIAAAEAAGVGFVLGVPLGMIGGFIGGWIDAAISRANDALMSVPFLLFAFTVVAVLGPGLTNAMLAVGVAFAPQFFRIARASTQQVRHETFIEAATAIGATPTDTLVRHVLPNAFSPLAVQTSVVLGLAVSVEASLSFLGLGAQPPTASWGGMLKGGMPFLDGAPFLVIIPGIFIAVTVLAFTLAGDGLRQALGTRPIGAASVSN